jgi:ornithine carbamoyltransferase
MLFMPGKVRHFISINDLTSAEIKKIFNLAIALKKNPRKYNKALKDRTLAMIFEKPSLRTRVSFEAGMTQLGGHAIYLGPNDIQMGVRETPGDIARNLERMVDIIMARVFEHQKLLDLSKGTKAPVINGLSDLEHPCQAMADILTVLEKKKKLKGLKLAFVGDGNNNVTRSLYFLCNKLGIDFICSSPKSYGLKMGKETQDPKEAVKNADIVVTDTWVSMGEEKEKKGRLKVFPPYQINKKLMSYAKSDAIFMHCLPAYRGYEVTDEVIDGLQSVVFDEAENRLHVQKAIMLFLVGK